MRTIKFRGKTIRGNKWKIGNLCQDRDGVFISDSGCYGWSEVYHETVGQYWRKVNNQELYDGDVFESRAFEDKPRWIVQYREDEGCICIAHPEELRLKYVYPWQKPDRRWWEEFGNDLFIIGNIHDNPELLKP